MNIIEKNVKAYPVLKRRFFKYLQGVHNMPEGWSANRLFWDYLRVRRRWPDRRVSISEYFIFAFYSLNKKGQAEYLTDMDASLRMRPHNEEIKEYLHDKAQFLRLFSDYVSRDWIELSKTDAEGLRAFAEKHGSIALKPATSSWGIGFIRADYDKVKDWNALYERLRGRGYIAECFIHSCPELARFHPASLNTIRVITFRNGERFGVFGSGLRVGNNGLLVDNAHGGGIFCEIDPATGEVITDGLDEYGNVYIEHPISGERFKGTIIPRWQEVIALCENASRTLPALRIVGWDVALLDNGKIELIEGNHNPGMNIVQAPAKHGVKRKFEAMIGEYFG